MSQVTGLPDTRPEGSVLITSPMTKVDLNIVGRSITCHFGPGEEVTLPLTPDLAFAQLVLATEIASVLSEDQLVWADPAMVKAELAKR